MEPPPPPALRPPPAPRPQRRRAIAGPRPPPPPPQPPPRSAAAAAATAASPRRSSSGGSRATPEVTTRTCQTAPAGNRSPRARAARLPGRPAGRRRVGVRPGRRGRGWAGGARARAGERGWAGRGGRRRRRGRPLPGGARRANWRAHAAPGALSLGTRAREPRAAQRPGPDAGGRAAAFTACPARLAREGFRAPGRRRPRRARHGPCGAQAGRPPREGATEWREVRGAGRGAGPRRGRGQARRRPERRAARLRGGRTGERRTARVGRPRGARPEAAAGDPGAWRPRRWGRPGAQCAPRAGSWGRGRRRRGTRGGGPPCCPSGDSCPREPLRKKKKVDPKKDQAAKERLKKRIRRLEKATQELIPIEDFITPVKLLNQARQRPPVELPFEESERRALLLKKWSLYKQREHELERAAIASLLEAQREALQELELTAPELHAEATKRDPSLFPFERQGPDYTPPIANYQPPEGRYQDITKVYTQVEFKR
ncbi:large ribosomal subunit protein mL40 isoform X1 [Bos mutus]|uniref:large ribosomal subunit protein mL40 isoform X1 n=1 Tax=Bos mutus TaxID=72004 RepID=UPI0038B58908